MTGKVKSIGENSFVVTAQVPKQSKNSNKPPKFTKRNVKVTLTGSSTITHSVEATDSVVVIGACLTTQGSTDSVGTVTAKTVTVSQPESDGSCSPGFGGFGGFPGGFPGGAPTNSSTT